MIPIGFHKSPANPPLLISRLSLPYGLMMDLCKRRLALMALMRAFLHKPYGTYDKRLISPPERTKKKKFLHKSPSPPQWPV